MRSFGFAAGLLCGILIAIGITSRAADWLVLSGYARHLSGGEHCNSTTTGIGLERNAYAAGAYRNSNCKWSAYAARSWMPLHAGAVKLGTIGGLVSGYGRPLTPVAGFAASVEGDRYGLNVIYIPPAASSGNVLWFTAKVRF
jgi:hypothetical protein